MNGHLVSGRLESPRQALIGVGPGVVASGVYDGTWGLVDMVFALLEKTGPSDVTVSSWTFKGADVEQSIALSRSKDIRSLRFLVDLNFCDAQPELVRALRKRFGFDAVVEWRAHSKFLVISGGEFDVLYLSSTNLHKNRRFESFTLCCDSNAGAEYLAVVDDLLANPPVRRRFSRDGLARELPPK